MQIPEQAARLVQDAIDRCHSPCLALLARLPKLNTSKLLLHGVVGVVPGETLGRLAAAGFEFDKKRDKEGCLLVHRAVQASLALLGRPPVGWARGESTWGGAVASAAAMTRLLTVQAGDLEGLRALVVTAGASLTPTVGGGTIMHWAVHRAVSWWLRCQESVSTPAARYVCCIHSRVLTDRSAHSDGTAPCAANLNPVLCTTWCSLFTGVRISYASCSSGSPL